MRKPASTPRGERWRAARWSFFKNLALSLGALSLTLVRVIELHSWALPLLFVGIVLIVTWLGETLLAPLQRRLLTSFTVLAQILLYWDRLGPEVLVGLVVVAYLWAGPLRAWWNKPRSDVIDSPWFGGNAKRLVQAYRRTRGVLHGIPPRAPKKPRAD